MYKSSTIFGSKFLVLKSRLIYRKIRYIWIYQLPQTVLVITVLDNIILIILSREMFGATDELFFVMYGHAFKANLDDLWYFIRCLQGKLGVSSLVFCKKNTDNTSIGEQVVHDCTLCPICLYCNLF